MPLLATLLSSHPQPKILAISYFTASSAFLISLTSAQFASADLLLFAQTACLRKEKSHPCMRKIKIRLSH